MPFVVDEHQIAEIVMAFSRFYQSLFFYAAQNEFIRYYRFQRELKTFMNIIGSNLPHSTAVTKLKADDN